MSAPSDSWHFIRPNEANRYPRRVICFDTEAIITERRSYERQTFRIAVASYDLFRGGDPAPVKSEITVEYEPAHLWEWVDARCKSKSRTVCFAQNLAYDLRLSDALRILPRLGWEPTFLTVDSNRCVARFRKRGASLLLCDLASWLPTSLDRVADSINLKKLPLPKQDAPISDWVDRCNRDVQITRAAVLRILNWLETNDMGSFRLTGPAQAMAAYRHRFMPHYGLLVHKDPDALAAERRAVWAGRCEVWRHGEINEPLYEWDFRLAYLNIALTTAVPTRLRGCKEGMSVNEVRRLSKHRAVLSDCVVSTDAPIVPAQGEKGIVWPVGAFQTTLWDNELAIAVASGARVEVQNSWVYMKSHALHDWAKWLLDMLGPNGLPVDALERIMLKDWARSLIGRFGSRWPKWDKIAKLPESGLELLPYVELETGKEGAYMQNGHDYFERTGFVDAPDAMPAIMGYIMAEARTRLFHVMRRLLPGQLVYCDTDSLIVDAEGNRYLESCDPDYFYGNLIQKASYKRGLFLGPRQIRLDTELRVAGLPKTAIQKSPRSFEAVLWEGLAESIRRGHPSEVRVHRRHVTVRGTDNRRRHLAGGLTAPIRLAAAEKSPV